MTGEQYKNEDQASPKKKITFFNSFEEAEEHGLRQMASHSHEERLRNLQTLRKRTWNHLLLPDGNWPPMEKIITIEYCTFLNGDVIRSDRPDERQNFPNLKQ